MIQKEWYRVKLYPHIGLPLNWRDKQKTCSYIKNKENIQKHSFLPFIHKTIVSRKFRKSYDDDGNILLDGKRQLKPPKKRHIFYASHLDANIFSYYAHVLGKKYEKKLQEKGLNEVVTAYRRIPLKGTNRCKCNIDFANDVFSHIKNQKGEYLVAITFDIKSFFDNLNHNKLKQSWCSILNTPRLDDKHQDHYKIFRNITKFSYVEEKDLFNLFKDSIITRTKSGHIRKKKVDKLKYLYQQNAIAFCEKKDIHLIRSKGLIKANKYKNGKLRDFGICQGSPLSPVLANIYMLDFDECIHNEAQKFNSLYRRYSDDMVIICPIKKKEYFIKLIQEQIDDISKLEIQPEKTQIFHFFNHNSQYICAQEFNGKINENSFKRNFEYLGFSFNGNYTYLKNSSLAKYYRKMKRHVRYSSYYANNINNKTNGKIFKHRLYKKYSYQGARRKIKYERVRGKTDKWRKTSKYDWGNFITYAKLAANSLEDNKIKSQIKNHWKNLNSKINER